MRSWITAAALALATSLAFLPAATADARPAPTADARPWAGGAPPRVADRAPARERARQKIRALRAMILVQELGLDEATAAKLGPILARHDDELARLQAERQALRRTLRDARAAGQDAKLDALIDQTIANARARWDREQARFAEVRRLLTPRQAARLLEVLPQVDRRILQGLRRAVATDDADALDGDDGDGELDDAPRPRPRRLRRGR